MDDAKAIGQTLLTLRRNLEISQKGLAVKAKVPLTTLYHHEHGHKAPSTDELMRYCKVLRCSFDEFLSLHGQLKAFRERSPTWAQRESVATAKAAPTDLASELTRLAAFFADEVAKRLAPR